MRTCSSDRPAVFLVLLLVGVVVVRSVESHGEQLDQLQSLARACAKGDDDDCKRLVAIRGPQDAYSVARVGPAALIHRLAAAAPEHTDRIGLLRIGADRFPNDASLHYALGQAILQTGKNVGSTDLEAYGPLLRAVELEPDFVEALEALGSIELNRGRADLAVERFRAALRKRPGLVTTRISLGHALLKLRRPGEAAEEFHAALGLPGVDGRERDVARVALEEIAFWRGDAGNTLNVIRQGTKKERIPGPGVACIEAVTLWWLGHDDEARRMCEYSVEGPLYCNCQGRGSSGTAASRPPTLTAEDKAVVLAALSKNRDLGVADGIETIVEGTSAFSEVNLPAVANVRGRFLELAQQYDDQSTVAEAVEDLLARSRTPAVVDLPRNGMSRPRALSRLEMQQVITGGTSFYERFPKARGFVTISRPGFSKQHRVAALAVQHNDGLWNGPVYLFVLDRQNEAWTLRAEADTRRSY